MCVCACTYFCACMHICAYVCGIMCVFLCIHMRVCEHAHNCMHACVCNVCICGLFICICVHVYMKGRKQLATRINQTSFNIKYSVLIKGRRGAYKARVPAECRKTKRKWRAHPQDLSVFFGPRRTRPKLNVIGDGSPSCTCVYVCPEKPGWLVCVS